MSPDNDYVIRGTVYETINKGRTEVRITIASGGSISQDIYIVGNTQPALGLTLTAYNITQDAEQNRPITVTTSETTGKYLLSCNNFSDDWNVGDVVRIIASNVATTYETEESNHNRSQSHKRILVDTDGNEVSGDNPLPVILFDENINNLNTSKVITTNTKGQPTQIDALYKGVTYRKTYTYTTQGFPIGESAWIKV